MVFDQLYETCKHATGGDKHYCRQIVNTLKKLSHERVVAYRGKRDVKHIVVLPYDDNPAVDISAGKDRSLIVTVNSNRYTALIRYVYDGELRPAHAVVSNIEFVNMLNMHVSFKDILREFFLMGEDYEQ
jgi:hypothetical protein